MKPSCREISAATAGHYQIPLDKLMGKSRDRKYSHPRQMAMYLSRMMTGKSFPDIGAAFNRDHTTVLHARRCVFARMDDYRTIEAILAIASEATRQARTREETQRAAAHALHAELASRPAPEPPAPKKRKRRPTPAYPPRWMMGQYDSATI